LDVVIVTNLLLPRYRAIINATTKKTAAAVAASMAGAGAALGDKVAMRLVSCSIGHKKKKRLACAIDGYK